MSAAVLQQNAGSVSGNVLETMNSGGYTYLLIDTGKAKQWVAIPESSVQIGKEVSCNDGMEMRNFTSKTLNRTFDSVIFSAGIVSPTPPDSHGEGGMGKNSDRPHPPAAHPETKSAGGSDTFSHAAQAEGSPISAMEAKKESGGSNGAMAPAANINVPKATGKNSRTVEEIFTGTRTLDGKTIRVHGMVIKSSPNIMGKNWIHIQDGTGDPLKSTHDLVITTNAEPPAVKAIVTIEGIVRANKDFGAGYRYAAIVEEAKIIE
ncbi:MAG: DNA-binding protein [Desulfobulbaceae bacterium A2]|nr:MAG: DNA-binding protein [Desulfobulbaceae bacterium A2]